MYDNFSQEVLFCFAAGRRPPTVFDLIFVGGLVVLCVLAFLSSAMPSASRFVHNNLHYIATIALS